MSNIGVLTKRFSITGNDEWIIDDLVNELIGRGNHLFVFYLDLEEETESSTKIINDNLTLVSYSIRDKNRNKKTAFGKLKLLYGLLSSQAYFKKEIKKFQLDCVISTSQFSFFLGVANASSAKDRFAILWDFYPIHAIEIGIINSRFLGKALYWLENRELASFNRIFFMTQANILFFNNYHRNLVRNTLSILPVWSKRPDDNLKKSSGFKNLDQDYLYVVFGGTLSKGRGIDFLINVANICKKRLKCVKFVLVGGGEQFNFVKRSVGDLGNVLMIDKLPRCSYRQLLEQCHIGMVVTVPGVSIPSFPSKSLDYMLAKLPILASVEKTTDFGEIIQNSAKCGFYSEAGNLNQFLANLEKLVVDKALRKMLGENGYKYFGKTHDVKIIGGKIERYVTDV